MTLYGKMTLKKFFLLIIYAHHNHSGLNGGLLKDMPMPLSYFPGDSDGKESASNVEDAGSIPGWERSPGGGNGNPLQYSCLENSRNRGVWWATVHGVAKSRTGLRD